MEIRKYRPLEKLKKENTYTRIYVYEKKNLVSPIKILTENLKLQSHTTVIFQLQEPKMYSWEIYSQYN